MLTDNWPVDFIYISRRIVRDIVQQHEAARSDRPFKIGLTGSVPLGPVSPGVSIESSKSPVEYTNYYELAKRATAAISDHTGWLTRDRPDRIPTGPYVRAKIYLQVQKVPLPLTVWERVFNHPIAIFAGMETLPEVGRVFVGLAGSASNFLHVHGGGPSMATRMPSDAVGIYDIIQQSRELTKEGTLEPGISAHHLDIELQYCSNEEDRFQEAAGLFTACGLSEPSNLYEALIRVHHISTNIDLGFYDSDGFKIGPFDLVLLGAPVWVSTLEPQQDEIALPSGRRRRQGSRLISSENFWDTQLKRTTSRNSIYLPTRPIGLPRRDSVHRDVSSLMLHQASALRRTSNWGIFDQQLDTYLATISKSRTSREDFQSLIFTEWPPNKAYQWQEFGEWFADIAFRLGPDPRPFIVPLRQNWWNSMRTILFHQSPKLTIKYGWSIPSVPHPIADLPNYDDYNVIALLDGTTWIIENGLPWKKRKLQPVLQNGQEKEVVAASIFRIIAQWRTPMTNKDQVPVVNIIPNEGR